jgi:hypothetical protein
MFLLAKKKSFIGSATDATNEMKALNGGKVDKDMKTFEWSSNGIPFNFLF